MNINVENLKVLHDLWICRILSIDKINTYLNKKEWLLGHITNSEFSVISQDRKTKLTYKK